MRQVTGNMTSVVKGMDRAMESMNLEKVRHADNMRDGWDILYRFPRSRS
jgi:hypothetical protein